MREGDRGICLHCSKGIRLELTWDGLVWVHSWSGRVPCDRSPNAEPVTA